MGLKTITTLTALMLLSAPTFAADLHIKLQDSEKNNVITATNWTIVSAKPKKILTATGSVLNISLSPGKYTVTAKTKNGLTGNRTVVITTGKQQTNLIVR